MGEFQLSDTAGNGDAAKNRRETGGNDVGRSRNGQRHRKLHGFRQKRKRHG